MIAGLLLLAAAACQSEQPTDEQTGAVLATVGTQKITESDMQRTLAALPEQVRAGLEANPERKAELLEMLVAREMAALEAGANNWLADPDLKKQLEDGRKQVLYNYWIKKEIELTEVSEDVLRQFYQENIDKFRVGEQREISIISAQDEPTIKRAADRLKAGDDFAAVAKEMSVSPSAKDGGAMGAVGKGDLVKELDEAAFGTESGQVSAPIHTQFGWHLIKVTAITPPQEKPFESVRVEIEPYAKGWAEQQRYKTRLEELKTKYAVVYPAATPEAAPAMGDQPAAPPVAQPTDEPADQPAEGETTE